MRRALAVAALALLACATPLFADDQPRLVRVEAEGERAETLFGGFDVIERHGRELKILAWPGDEERLAALGLAVELLDAAPGRTAAARSRAELARRGPLQATGGVPPFGSGSMGGYWTLAEVKTKLEQTGRDDTHDVVADKIDTLGVTRQGRPIWGAHASASAVPGPDTRPVVFYNALTHAREPSGMQALFYFVDDLLSRLRHRSVRDLPARPPRHLHRAGGEPRRLPASTRTPTSTAAAPPSASGARTSATTTATASITEHRRRRPQPQLRLPVGARQRRLEPVASRPRPTAARRRSRSPRPGPARHRDRAAAQDRDLVPHLQRPAAPPLGLDHRRRRRTPSAFYEWNDEMTRGNGYLTGPGAPGPLRRERRVQRLVLRRHQRQAARRTPGRPRSAGRTTTSGRRPRASCRSPRRTCAPAIHRRDRRRRSCGSTRGAIDGRAQRRLRRRTSRCARATWASPATAGPGSSARCTALDAGARVLSGTASPTRRSRRAPAATPPGGGRFQVAVDDTVTPGRLLRFRVEFTATGGSSRATRSRWSCGTPTVLAVDDASSGTGAVDRHDRLGHRAATTRRTRAATSPTARPGTTRTNANRPLTRTGRAQPVGRRPRLRAVRRALEFEVDYDAGVSRGQPRTARPGRRWPPTGTTLAPRRAGTQPIGTADLRRHAHRWRARARRPLRVRGLRRRPRCGSASAASRTPARSYDGFNFDSLRVLLYDPAAQPAPVAVGDGVRRRRRLELAAPSPNPARGGPARFAFALPRAGAARLELARSRRAAACARWPTGPCAAGSHVRAWDGRDEAGRAAPAGLYLARLEAGGRVAARRLVLLR